MRAKDKMSLPSLLIEELLQSERIVVHAVPIEVSGEAEATVALLSNAKEY